MNEAQRQMMSDLTDSVETMAWALDTEGVLSEEGKRASGDLVRVAREMLADEVRVPE